MVVFFCFFLLLGMALVLASGYLVIVLHYCVNLLKEKNTTAYGEKMVASLTMLRSEGSAPLLMSSLTISRLPQ